MVESAIEFGIDPLPEDLAAVLGYVDSFGVVGCWGLGLRELDELGLGGDCCFAVLVGRRTMLARCSWEAAQKNVTVQMDELTGISRKKFAESDCSVYPDAIICCAVVTGSPKSEGCCAIMALYLCTSVSACD